LRRRNRFHDEREGNVKTIEQKIAFRDAKAMERKWAHRVGTISINWERLHFRLTVVISILATSTTTYLGEMKRIGSAPSDSVKRKLMRDCLTGKKFLPKVRDELTWVLDQVDKLTHLRNGFVHQVALISVGQPPQVHLDPMLLMDRYQEVKRDPEGAYRTLKADLITLTEYAANLFGDVPKPKRPKLKAFTLFPNLGKRT
jgi:hypothetical protein